MSDNLKSAITITYQLPFIKWHNKQFPELPMEEDMLGEASTYIIKGDFDDPEKLLQKYFKQIFEAELSNVNADKATWPSSINLNLFEDWFYYEISDTVVEL